MFAVNCGVMANHGGYQSGSAWSGPQPHSLAPGGPGTLRDPQGPSEG